MTENLAETIQHSNESLLQLNRELDFLCRAGQVINSSLDLKKVLRAFIKEVRRLMGVVGCSVWLISSNKKEVVCLQATGQKSNLIRGWRLPLGKGVVGWIAKNGEGLLIKDTREDKRHYKKVDSQTGLEIRSIIGVPIHFEEKALGVLEVVDTIPDRFKRRQLRIMDRLVASAGVAITNAMLFDRTKQEIAARKQTEKMLRKREEELEASSQNLEELNTALRVLLQKRAEDKKQMEEQVLINVRKLVDPYLKKFHQSGLNRDQSELLDILERNLEDIVSPFSYRLSLEHFDITRREFNIATLVRQGRRNREIAVFLGIIQRTVETHRRNLRVKLGIDNQKDNLRAHLMSMVLENP